MTFPEFMSLVAGVLQFIVAGYALRLNRLFGPARVGWSLFWAFSLLALLHLVQSVVTFHGATSFGAEIEVTYALISLLLLTGMLHLEAVLKERLRLEQNEQQMRVELESEVKTKTDASEWRRRLKQRTWNCAPFPKKPEWRRLPPKCWKAWVKCSRASMSPPAWFPTM